MRNVNAFAEQKRSAILRYAAAVLSVIAAVNILWWMDILFQSAAHVSLFLCAANGAGIPAEILPRIFDLFVTTKPPAISQEITKAHGGIIKVSSHHWTGHVGTNFVARRGERAGIGHGEKNMSAPILTADNSEVSGQVSLKH